MGLSTHDGDFRVKGNFTSLTMDLPAEAVDDDSVAAAAGIQATKLEHDHLKLYQQELSANAAAESRVLHFARNAGEVQAFEVGLVTPPDTATGSSGRTATFDFKKNGASILSATVQLDSTNLAYVTEAAALGAGATYAAGDVFTVVVTVGGSAGTHAKGVFAQASFREIAAS